MVHASVTKKKFVLEIPILVNLVVVCVGITFLAVVIRIVALMALVNAELMMPAKVFHCASMEHVPEEVRLATPYAEEILIIAAMAYVNAELVMPATLSHCVSMEHVSEEVPLAIPHAQEILILAVMVTACVELISDALEIRIIALMASVNAALMMPAIFSQRVSMEHVEESEKV